MSAGAHFGGAGATEGSGRFPHGPRALRNEFVLSRGLFLRVYPLAFDGEGIDYESILSEEGFSAAPLEIPQRTFLLDLEASLERFAGISTTSGATA